MKIWGLLCWYEEPASWLVHTVTSLKGFCDGVIAVDGPYASFPGALRVPRSAPEQAEAILRACWGSDMALHLYSPMDPWWGEEVAKRNFMFEVADNVAEEGDWYFIVDADESIHRIPGDIRKRLEESEQTVADVDIWTRPNEHYPSPRLYRGRGVRVEITHYNYVKDGVRIGWVPNGQKPFPKLDMTELVLEHRGIARSVERKEQKRVYYDLVASMEQALAETALGVGSA